MAFQVLPLELRDFDELVSHAAKYPPGEDLIGQPAQSCCLVATKEEAEARLIFHFNHQKARFLGDSSVRYMKVVDTANQNAILSIARWHYYPNGHDFDAENHWDCHVPIISQAIPNDFNIPAHNHILTSRNGDRATWIAAGAPCWILMHLVTLPAYRGKGAAALLVQWGIDQCDKMGVPAYLEAGAMGVRVYAKLGFVQVGELFVVDAKEFGFDTLMRMTRMVYYPKADIQEAMENVEQEN